MGRFDLVTLDLDGTLLPHDTVFAVVLRAAGRGDEVAASDARYSTGASTLEACFREQWAWVQELSPADLHRALRKAAWLPGIASGVARLRDAGLRATVLTDQPTTCTDFLARWGLEDAIASPVTVQEGKQVAIEMRFDKWANLQERLAAEHLAPERVVHVGNGSNDVPVWEHVGAGVAVYAPKDVARHATVDLGAVTDFRAVADAVLHLHGA